MEHEWFVDCDRIGNLEYVSHWLNLVKLLLLEKVVDEYPKVQSNRILV